MRRREFIAIVGGAAAWPLAARAQDARKPARIGYMTPLPLNPSFVQGLRELGYFEGRDFEIEYRNSRAPGSLPALAEELVRLNPDVILAGGLDTVVALRNATQTIPIVSPTLADAVHIGLIASEARPGGNVTGIEPYVAGLPAKEMELAREIVPGASEVGLLTNLSDPKAAPQARELEAAGRKLEVDVTSSDANRPEEIESALQVLASRRVGVVIVLQSSLLLSNSQQIAALALAKRLPTIYGYREHWRARQLWRGSELVLAPSRLFRRQDLARRSTGRSAGRVPDKDAADDQPQNGPGSWPHCAIVSARSGR